MGIAALGVGVAAALPWLGHAGIVSRFDVSLVPLGCDLNRFDCAVTKSAFWLPVVALVLAGAIFGAVVARRAGRGAGRAALAAGLGAVAFSSLALVTQATVGDNPLTSWLNGLLPSATRDEIPVWIDIARDFGVSLFAVAAAVTFLVGAVTVGARRAVAGALAAGGATAVAFVIAVWFLDQIAGMSIVPSVGPSQMPRVALVAHFAGGVAGATAGLVALGRHAAAPGPSMEPIPVA